MLVKPVKSAIDYMPMATYELPYDGAKEMLLVDNIDHKEYKKHLSDGKPFKKCSKQILEEHPELNIAAIDNSQAIFVENRQRRDFSLQ